MKALKSNVVYLVSSNELTNVAMTHDAYKMYKKVMYNRDIEEYLSHNAIKVKKDLLLCPEYEILDIEDIRTNKY